MIVYWTSREKGTHNAFAPEPDEAARIRLLWKKTVDVFEQGEDFW